MRRRVRHRARTLAQIKRLLDRSSRVVWLTEAKRQAFVWQLTCLAVKFFQIFREKLGDFFEPGHVVGIDIHQDAMRLETSE
jgi:hypothetical protein